MNFAGLHIYPDDNKRNDFHEICSKQMDKTMTSFLIKMANIFVSFLVALSLPVYDSIFLGGKQTTTMMRFFFTAEGSNVEFLCNCTLQQIIGVHAILLYVGLEVFMALIQDAITIAPIIAGHDLKQLCKEYRNGSISKAAARIKFMTIAQKSADADV